MIPAYKKASGVGTMDEEHEYFNTKFARLQIISEHCMGILKNTCTCLKKLSFKIDQESDVKEVVDLFKSCAIINNLMVSYDDINKHWYENTFEDIGGYAEELDSYFDQPEAKDEPSARRTKLKILF